MRGRMAEVTAGDNGTRRDRLGWCELLCDTRRMTAAAPAHVPPATPLFLAARPPTRDAFFDNARFVMLALVFIGHAIEPWQGPDRPMRALYLSLYAFHMPAFVWLAGRFASAELTRTRAVRVVERILLPLLIFQVLYAVFHHWANGTPAVEIGLVRPYWILWFLMSLLTWRLLMPVFAVLPTPVAVAVVVALTAGLTPSIDYDFSLSRTAVFLPFFLLGWRTRKQDFAWLSTPWARWASVVVLLGLVAAAWRLAPQVSERWLYASVGYASLGVGPWTGMAVRLGLLVVATVAGAAVLAWVPRRRLAWSALGSRTLQAFLLHGFLVRGAIAAGWLAPAVLSSRASQVVLVVGAVALAALLCTAWVERALGWLVAPPISRWLAAQGPDKGLG